MQETKSGDELHQEYFESAEKEELKALKDLNSKMESRLDELTKTAGHTLVRREYYTYPEGKYSPHQGSKEKERRLAKLKEPDQ